MARRDRPQAECHGAAVRAGQRCGHVGVHAPVVFIAGGCGEGHAHLGVPSGPSIGNFDAAGTLTLLRQACEAAGGALLIGVHLLEVTDVFEATCDDVLGVAAVFVEPRHWTDPRGWFGAFVAGA